MLYHTALHCNDMDETAPRKTHHCSPSQVSYGVFVVRILEKVDYIIRALDCICQWHTTEWFHCNTVNILQITHNRHPIARPWGRAMGCLLWVQSLFYVLPLSQHYCIQYIAMFDCVTTPLYCTLWNMTVITAWPEFQFQADLRVKPKKNYQRCQ